MRKLMLSVAMTAGVTMALAASATAAHADPLAQRLGSQINRIEQINESRPRGDVYGAIAHCVDLVRARLRDLYSGRLSQPAVLAEIDDAVHGIGVYSSNGNDIAPMQDAQTASLVARMRQEISEAQVALNGGYGGYGGGYGGMPRRGAWAPVPPPRYAPSGYAPSGYAPAAPPAPAYLPPPVPAAPTAYVPPPAPAGYRY